MSERGSALLDVLADETGMYREGEFAEKFPGAYRVRSPEVVARAICEHLGITWETHAMLLDVAPSGHQSSEHFAGHDPQGAAIDFMERHAAAIATLLEAAGVER